MYKKLPSWSSHLGKAGHSSNNGLSKPVGRNGSSMEATACFGSHSFLQSSLYFTVNHWLHDSVLSFNNTQPLHFPCLCQHIFGSHGDLPFRKLINVRTGLIIKTVAIRIYSLCTIGHKDQQKPLTQTMTQCSEL